MQTILAKTTKLTEALEQQTGGCDSFDPDNFEDFLKNLLGAMEPEEKKS